MLTAAAFALTFLAVGSTASAQLQDDAQAKCLKGFVRSAGKVLNAQSKATKFCVKETAKGDESEPNLCLSRDSKGKIQRAVISTGRTHSTKCAGEATPDFGIASSNDINAAALTLDRNLVQDAFGTVLINGIIEASSDRGGAKCQAALLGSYQGMVKQKSKVFSSCQTVGLKKDTLMDAAGLEACVAGATPGANSKVDKALSKLKRTAVKKCTNKGVALTDALPGTCVGADDIPACLGERVECRFCLAVNASSALAADCDTIDDGIVNSSCS